VNAVPTGALPSLPAAGINLHGYRYWGTELPFTNFAGMSSGWVSTPEDESQWIDGREIPLTSGGYPARLERDQMARSFVFTHNGGWYPTGKYVLSWKGDGDVRLADKGPREISRDWTGRNVVYEVPKTSGFGLIIEVTRTNPDDPARDIFLKQANSIALSGTFNATFLADLAGFGVIRMMDWNATNNHPIARWKDRARPTDFNWGSSRGIPYEPQIALCNQLGQDMWVTVPHRADDHYVSSLAALVRNQLAPGLRVWVEYSNEVWNSTFEQHAYARDTLAPRYSSPNLSHAYGRRAAEVFELFTQQIPAQGRVVAVLSGQAGNPWVLQQAVLGNTINGEVQADVAAVAAYFDFRRDGIDRLFEDHRQGTVDLAEVFRDLRLAIDEIATQWSSNAQLASAQGLPLVAYEAGQHLVARPGEQHNDPGFVELLQRINRDPRMGGLYLHLTEKWKAAGGETIVFFNDVGRWDKWGSWGLREHYLDYQAAKYQAVRQYIQSSSGVP
jgi:hypothetical protein